MFNFVTELFKNRKGTENPTDTVDADEQKYKHLKMDSKSILKGDDSQQAEELLREIWRYVSISSEQYELHYRGLIERACVFSQDASVILAGLERARDGLSGTMIKRLPHGRSREKTHGVEQLWKYTMFSCYLLDELYGLNRCFYDGGDRLLECLDERATQWDDNGPLKQKWVLISSMQYLFCGVTREWLSQDDGKALAEIMRISSGERCFISSDVVVEGKSEEPVKVAENEPERTVLPLRKVKEKKVKKDVTLILPGSPEHPLSRKTLHMENVVNIDSQKSVTASNNSCIQMIFDWAESKGYREDDGYFIPGLPGCKEFIEESEWEGTIRELQDQLFDRGAVNAVRAMGGKKIRGYIVGEQR